MPQRPSTALTKKRDGSGNETIYSPGSAMIYVKSQLNRSVGDSTLRMWRKTNTGPAFHKDGYGFVWYRESDLKKFFLGREEVEQKGQMVLEADDLHEPDAVQEMPTKGLFDIKPEKRKDPKKKLVSAGRPRLSSRSERPRLTA